MSLKPLGIIVSIVILESCSPKLAPEQQQHVSEPSAINAATQAAKESTPSIQVDLLKKPSQQEEGQPTFSK